MRTLLVTLFALSLVGTVRAQPKTEYPALKQRLQRGNFAEALAGYDELAKNEKLPLAFIGQAACYRAQGENLKALDALDAGLKASPDNPDLLGHRADLLLALGKWDDATKDAEAAIKKDAKHFLARWVRARVLRDKGDLAAADTEMRWFVKAYSDAAAVEKEITDPEKLLIVAQAGIENATTHNKPDQFKFILTEVLRDALKADADCWQAEYLSGQLFLDKHNRADAANSFDAALKINPKAVEALVGNGLIALERMDFADAERQADSALKVNPKHPGALRLKADVRFAEADYPGAEKLLLAAKAINPRDESTLARLAAIRYLTSDKAGYDTLGKEVEAFDTKPATFHLELGTIFTDTRQFVIAAECFEKASTLRPTLPGPKAGLGLLLYMQGREPEARTALKAAMKADPFNVKADNALTVLDELAEYATTETPHFVIRFDKKNDKVLAAFLADVLEETFAELAKQYGFTPPGKILVEVFARRQMFSGRIAMLPGLPGAVQGACTGPLIALPSPRADGGTRAYNWAVVVRHELTHAFNLLQTGHRAPVWLTEGLAVRAENTKRFGQVALVLRDRLAAGTAFDLDTISRAYKRFNQPADVMLAYYQGLLYVEYIAKAHGEEGIAKLLNAYKVDSDTTVALKAALGVEKVDFEAGYRKYIADVVKSAAPRRPDKPMTFAELEAAHKAKPDDLDLAARLAGEYLRRDKPADAKALAEAVRAKEKGHPGASIVAARLLRRAKDEAGAKAALEEAVAGNPEDGRVLLEFGKLLFELKDYDKTAATFENGLKFAPGEADWLEQLVRVYDTAKKPDELARVLSERIVASPDDIALHIRLAKLHANANRPQLAESVARRALYIDVLNTEARDVLIAVLDTQKKTAEIEALRKRYE
ncbi:tetratricopeptide repeat protein [Gemmata sp. SH-PL17]|uniref:tetratricopeptide repeat protein n=1 Tax=Gemmata sp. SH-PL17 TaxID=1630693 RepID=UPI00078E62FB|nr:tetratricopeptide repeat protein [Gemmata sp. SH-PL17]AMV26896.1 tetratricopeptide repeat protein [Gemmata sp. SH-PL17]